MKKDNEKLKGTLFANDRKPGDQGFLRGKSLAISFVALVVIALSVWAVWPHRTLKLRREFSLQNGRHMQTEMLLQSSWGWAVPHMIASLQVDVDGHEISVSSKAYRGMGPIDGARGVFIAESQGFPEVFVFGEKSQPLQRVMWKFMNYQYSERDVIRNNRAEIEYFTDTPRLASAPLVPLGAADAPMVKTMTLTPVAIQHLPEEKVKITVNFDPANTLKLSSGEAPPSHN